MQPLAVSIRAIRRKLVAENERDVHDALMQAENEAHSSGRMAIVDFEAANGNTISLIVGGHDDTALSFRYAGDVDPRFLSLGDRAATGSVAASRDFNHPIRCPRSALISRIAGLAALDEFAVTNELPACIEWKPFS
jgi:Immunity protein Imm1